MCLSGCAVDEPALSPDANVAPSPHALIPLNLGCVDLDTSTPLPIPDLSSCPPEDAWPDETKAPALAVEIGDVITGSYRAWDDGALVPIIHGPQGGIHIEVSARALGLDVGGEANAQLQLKGYANAGCALASLQSVAPVDLHRTSGDIWQHGPAGKTPSAVLIIMPVSSAQSHLYCGQWLEVHVMLRHKATGVWGAAHRRIRLYDTRVSP